MAESNSLSESVQHRSLRDRILDSFRITAPSNSTNGSPQYPPGTLSPQPDDRTGLLGSYEGRDPACGLKDACTHGTFSPRPERDGNHSRNSSEESGFLQGPENIPSMASSTVVSAPNRKSYVDHRTPANSLDSNASGVGTDQALDTFHTIYRSSIGLLSIAGLS